MNWPKNQAALSGHDWNIHTKREHFAELEALFKGGPFNLQLFEIGETMRVAGCTPVKTSQCEAGVILLNGIRDQIAYSIQRNSKMLLAPPDTIFGDGTIPNLIDLGTGPKTCVSVAHSRVLPGILEEIDVLGATRGGISNPQLVTMAFEHAHDSWKFADVSHPKNNSYIGGIAWRELEKGLYSVTHRLPTPYFCDFTQGDYDFFWGQVSFGGWDHRWPAENLIRQQRQRYVGSSDACFIVEVTEWDKNVPPDVSDQARKQLDYARVSGELDQYWNGHFHNEINRQTSVIFRGE